MRNLGWLEKQFEETRQTRDFIGVAKALLVGGGSGPVEARMNAAAAADSPRVQAILQKAAISPLPLSSLADYRLLVSSFASSLASVGVFDAMLAGGMIRVPLASATLGSVNVGATAYTVSEAGAKPVSKLSLTGNTLDVLKSHAILVLTQDLLRFSPEAETLLRRELTQSVALGTDTQFLNIITAGVVAGTSSGTQAVAFRDDLAIMLAAITTGNASRLFLIVTPSIAKYLAVLGATSTSGQPAFENMGVNGGTVGGIQVLVSDALAAGTMVLVDSTGIAAGSGNIELDVFNNATIQLDSQPDSPPTGTTNLLNLWQMNMTGIRVE
jgi:hypothetical protein